MSMYEQRDDSIRELIKQDSLEVGQDLKTITNEKGAKQSEVKYRFDLVDTKAMFDMCKVLEEGATKYGDNNWRGISQQEHINHALIHLYAYLANDKSDEHLSHALCRVMMSIGVENNNKGE